MTLPSCEGAMTTLCGARKLERARAAKRQRTVRMLVTPITMEALGWWYIWYLRQGAGGQF